MERKPLPFNLHQEERKPLPFNLHQKERKPLPFNLHQKQPYRRFHLIVYIFYILMTISVSTFNSPLFLSHAGLGRRGWTAFVSHRALGGLDRCVIRLHPLALGESLPQTRQESPLLVGVVGSTE